MRAAQACAPGVDDGADWSATATALNVILEANQAQAVWQILAALLHVGEMSSDEREDEDGARPSSEENTTSPPRTPRSKVDAASSLSPPAPTARTWPADGLDIAPEAELRRLAECDLAMSPTDATALLARGGRSDLVRRLRRRCLETQVGLNDLRRRCLDLAGLPYNESKEQVKCPLPNARWPYTLCPVPHSPTLPPPQEQGAAI
jgi:hypothetical protein